MKPWCQAHDTVQAQPSISHHPQNAAVLIGTGGSPLVWNGWQPLGVEWVAAPWCGMGGNPLVWNGWQPLGERKTNHHPFPADHFRTIPPNPAGRFPLC
eukprot:356699-Chlamydomonas_euryale.AAC.3